MTAVLFWIVIYILLGIVAVVITYKRWSIAPNDAMAALTALVLWPKFCYDVWQAFLQDERN